MVLCLSYVLIEAEKVFMPQFLIQPRQNGQVRKTLNQKQIALHLLPCARGTSSSPFSLHVVFHHHNTYWVFFLSSSSSPSSQPLHYVSTTAPVRLLPRITSAIVCLLPRIKYASLHLCLVSLLLLLWHHVVAAAALEDHHWCIDVGEKEGGCCSCATIVAVVDAD